MFVDELSFAIEKTYNNNLISLIIQFFLFNLVHVLCFKYKKYVIKTSF